MNVPYAYLPYEFQGKLLDKIKKEWDEFIPSCEYTLGSRVEEFEKEFAKATGARFAIGVNSGTDALILALRALGIGFADRVITTPLTFYASSSAIISVGAIPVYIDVDEQFQLDPNQIEQIKGAKAILPVYWGGITPDIKRIKEIADEQKLHLLYDCCMAFDTKERLESPNGHVAAWSLHPLKTLNVMGDGGAVTTNNEKLYQWMKVYRNHGMVTRDNISMWGANMRIQPLQAIVALEVLRDIPWQQQARHQVAAWISEGLQSVPQISRPHENKQCAHSTYFILAEKRNELFKFLNEKEIEAKIHYPTPLHLQPAARNLGYKKGDFPNAEKIADSILTLPCHPWLKKYHVDFMIEMIQEFYKEN